MPNVSSRRRLVVTAWAVAAEAARVAAAAYEDGGSCCTAGLSRDAVGWSGQKPGVSGAGDEEEDDHAPGRQQVVRASRDAVSCPTTTTRKKDVVNILVPSQTHATFRVGSDRPKIPGDGEGPSRLVRLSKPFAMDRFETTNGAFADFVRETNYVTESEKFGWSFVFHLELPEDKRAELAKDRAVVGVEWWLAVNGSYWREPLGPGSDVFNRRDGASLPVVQVTWHDAAAFCAWRDGRLPTEAEWEFAARGYGARRKNTLFPWGNDLLTENGTRHRANVWQGAFPNYNSGEDGHAFAAPVGSYDAQTASGLHDLIGNVWEWVEDWWSTPRDEDAVTYSNPVDDPRGPPTGTEKLKKGGSFLCHRSYCYRYRIAARHKNTPDSATSNNGFRCVYDLPDDYVAESSSMAQAADGEVL